MSKDDKGEAKKESRKEAAEKEVITKADYVPGTMSNLSSTLKITHELLNAYTEKFGTQLEYEEQREISALYCEADILLLEVNHAFYISEKLEREATKAVVTGKNYAPDKEDCEFLKKRVNELEKKILGLNEKTVALLKRISKSSAE